MPLEDNEIRLTHLDAKGQASMVDVSDKPNTVRQAIACGTICIGQKAWDLLNENPKGDVLATARIAGIQGAKKTSGLIPLCHPLPLSKAAVDFELDEKTCSITAKCLVKTTGPTGVEMEALSGAGIALLTIYDMCKAAGKEMVISDLHLLSKSGGKSGDFTWKES